MPIEQYFIIVEGSNTQACIGKLLANA